MIKELVIHLGDTKTGSTSIQKVLAGGLWKSPDKSIIYSSNRNHIALAQTLTKRRRMGEREERFERLYKAFQESDADLGIISAEHFQFVDPQALHHAIDTYWPDLTDRVRLVAYVRPHGDKMLSAFSERVKLGSMEPSLEEIFAALSDGDGLDYAPRFEKWQGVFGERFELRPFIRERLYKNDVVSDFFKYILGSEDFEIEEAVFANASLTISQLSLLREMHMQINETIPKARRMRVKEVRKALGRVITDYMQANGLGTDSDKPAMPAMLVERFTERYASDAEALDTAFFDGFPMSDALDKIAEKATEVPQPLDASKYFSAQTISSVQVFAAVLGGLLSESPEPFKKAIATLRSDYEIRL